MVEAFKGNLVCPNKQNDPLESFHEVSIVFVYVRALWCLVQLFLLILLPSLTFPLALLPAFPLTLFRTLSSYLLPPALIPLFHLVYVPLCYSLRYQICHRIYTRTLFHYHTYFSSAFFLLLSSSLSSLL